MDALIPLSLFFIGSLAFYGLCRMIFMALNSDSKKFSISRGYLLTIIYGALVPVLLPIPLITFAFSCRSRDVILQKWEEVFDSVTAAEVVDKLTAMSVDAVGPKRKRYMEMMDVLGVDGWKYMLANDPEGFKTALVPHLKISVTSLEPNIDAYNVLKTYQQQKAGKHAAAE